jgi:hypothetical protein
MGAGARSYRERFGKATRGFDDLIRRCHAMVGTRSRLIRVSTSDGHSRCSASDRVRVPARPAQHVHRSVPDRRDAGRARVHNNESCTSEFAQNLNVGRINLEVDIPYGEAIGFANPQAIC